MKENKNFAERLTKLIGGSSLRSFAKKCHIPESTLRGYLDGSRKPKFENLKRIADATTTNLEWLATGEGPISLKDRPSDMILNGNGSIQAGGAIAGKASIKNHAIPDSGQPSSKDLTLDDDERELILKLRDVGGKRTLRKFIKELDRIKKLLDDEI